MSDKSYLNPLYEGLGSANKTRAMPSETHKNLRENGTKSFETPKNGPSREVRNIGVGYASQLVHQRKGEKAISNSGRAGPRDEGTKDRGVVHE